MSPARLPIRPSKLYGILYRLHIKSLGFYRRAISKNISIPIESRYKIALNLNFSTPHREDYLYIKLYLRSLFKCMGFNTFVSV